MSDFKTHKISSAAGLMLDNLVYNRHGEVHGIRINDLHAFDHPDMGGNYGLYGIPLTEEWLIRMGFIIEKGISEETDCDRYIISNQIMLHFDGDNYWFGYWNIPKLGINIPIKTVHQLQNLYFSLTGEELTIK